MYEIKRDNRLSQASVHVVTVRASSFTDLWISGLPIRAKYKHLRTIWEHTFDNSPTDFISSSLNWWWSMHGVATLYDCWFVLFATSQYLSTQFFARPSMSWDHEETFASGFPVLSGFSIAPTKKSGFEYAPVIVLNILACLTFSLSASQINVVKEWCRFSQINVFHEYFPHWTNFLSSQFEIVHIHRQE